MTAAAAPARYGGLSRAMILALAAELEENAIKDQTYRETPIGRLVGRYLDELADVEYSPGTVNLREYILSKLALKFAHRDLAELTINDLNDFLVQWKDVKPNTKKSYRSSVRVFCEWAHDHDFIPSNPARKLRSIRGNDTERVSHSLDEVRRLIVAQDSRRDRCALLLMYWCALRRNELRLVQFRHLNLGHRVLTVFGKGGTVLEQNIPEPVALELERHIQDRQPSSAEYLLHPQRVGRYGTYPNYLPLVTWEDRMRPFSLGGIDKWWQRMLANADLPQFPMHEIRHTAGTHFHMEGHDLVATQHFMRHANPSTTAQTYVHLDRVRAVADVQRRMVDPMRDTSEVE